MYLNRIVAVLTAIAGLAGALAVPLGNLDTHSTTGVIAGLGTVTAAAVTWLVGWQKHEQRQADAGLDQGDLDEHPAVTSAQVPDAIQPDQGDANAARQTVPA